MQADPLTRNAFWLLHYAMGDRAYNQQLQVRTAARPWLRQHKSAICAALRCLAEAPANSPAAVLRHLHLRPFLHLQRARLLLRLVLPQAPGPAALLSAQITQNRRGRPNPQLPRVPGDLIA